MHLLASIYRLPLKFVVASLCPRRSSLQIVSQGKMPPKRKAEKQGKGDDPEKWLLKKGQRVEFAFSGLYYGGVIKGTYRTRHWFVMNIGNRGEAY
jgi:hypothetical protein